MMQVRKAIITAAGENQAQLPLQSVVDRSGNVRCAMQLIIDEVVAAGVEEVAIVVRPGLTDAFSQALDGYTANVTFFEQDHPRGYGDAILRASSFVTGEAFLHLVSDHLYVSRSGEGCAKQLVTVASQEECSVSAVQATRENLLSYFGVIGATPVPLKAGQYDIKTVVEKPTPTEAEQRLVVAGQRAGYYLCLFGMHVLTPQILTILEEELRLLPPDEKLNLSYSLGRLASQERYLASELQGERYDIGEKYGLLVAQLAIALSGEDRDRILTELLELVARRPSR